jgi:DNA replication initiation complex subunit (GINS family)
MVEIKVTYETLFDLLRREKGRNELQELDKSFYEDVSMYLTEKNKTLKISSSRGEKEKIKIQLKNIKKILKELYELREKKIISLASSKVRTSSNLIDTGKLISKEKELFKEACDLFSKYKTEILEKITQENQNEHEYEPEYRETKEKLEEKPQEKKEEKKEDTADNSIIKIKVIHNLPRFLGIDKKIYGPYEQGDETEMPLATAKLLLDKKRAERI